MSRVGREVPVIGQGPRMSDDPTALIALESRATLWTEDGIKSFCMHEVGRALAEKYQLSVGSCWSNDRRRSAAHRQSICLTSNPSRSARSNSILTEDGCQLVRPRGVRSRIDSNRSQIACSVMSGSAPLMAATIAGRRSSVSRRPARSSTSAGRNPSRT